jgi:hypothetical protein
LNRRAAEWGVTRVVCATDSVAASFQFLVQGHPGMRIEVPPRGFVAHVQFLLGSMRRATDVVFFHECCWLQFDLAMLLVRPRADHYPQVVMSSGFRPMDEGLIRWADVAKPPARRANATPLRRLLGMLVLRRWFAMYEQPVDGGEGEASVVLSLRDDRLPRITPHSIAESRRLSEPSATVSAGDSGSTDAARRRLLLLLGREPVDDAEQRALYDNLCAMAADLGYELLIKDHPREGGRLVYAFPGATVIPPETPFEVLDLNYRFLIGVCSTSLALFPAKAISLVKLLPMDPQVLSLRVAHLSALPGGSAIRYVESLAELGSVLASRDAPA